MIPALEDIGQRLYDTRGGLHDRDPAGSDADLNLLKDPTCHDPAIEHLRRLHEEMDRAVLDAYGWTDIEVPPFCPTTPAEQKALEAFQDEIIDRLFVLNAERAAEEARAAAATKPKGKPPTKPTRKRTKKPDDTQGGFGFD